MLKNIVFVLIFLTTNVFSQSSEEGFLVFKLKENQLQVNNASAPFDKRVLYVENMNTGKEFVISSNIKNGQSFYFGDQLKSGVYKIVKLVYAYGFGLEATSKFLDNSYVFEVKSDRITYLDEIIYTNFYSEKVDKILPIHVYNNEAPLPKVKSIIKAFFPEQIRLLDQEIVGWQKSEFNSKMPKFYARNKEISRGLFHPIEMTNGSILFGSTNGVLKVWNPKTDETQKVDLPTASAISSIFQNKDGSLLIGCENGELFYTTSLGDKFEKDTYTFSFGNISSIHEYNGKTYLTVKQGYKINVYKGGFNKDWNRVLTADYDSLNCNYCPEDRFSYVFEDQLIFSTKKQIFIYNLKSETIEIRETHKKIPATIASNGHLYVKTGATLKVSKDYGKNWKKIPKSIMLSAPVFFDEQDGLRIRRKRFKFKSIFLDVTKDGGKTWTETHEFDIYTHLPSVFKKLKTDNIWLATDTLNDLLISRDEGKTWESISF